MIDWKNEVDWLWLPEGESVNQYAEFRKEFSIDTLTSEKAMLHISADSRYVAYLNGEYLPLSQFADYPNYKVYDSFDISKNLKKGKNALCVIAYYQGEDSSVYRRGDAGLMFCITVGDDIIAKSEKQVPCRLSLDYKSGPEVEKITNQLSYSFRYNANAYDGWREIDYVVTKEANWVEAKVLQEKRPLFERPIHSLEVLPVSDTYVLSQGVFFDASAELTCGDRMQRAALAFREAEELGFTTKAELPSDDGIVLNSNQGDGVFLVLDLGKEECGYISFDIELEKAATVLVGFGEHLDDLRVRTSVGGRQFAAVYEAKEGRQTFKHAFKRVACRYVCLQIFASNVKVYSAGVCPTRYPVKYLSEFKCADAFHNRVFEVARRTLELCMHEHYEDCPWREQALYAMDSRNQILCGYYVFDNHEFVAASLKLLALGLREDGLLELNAPSRVPITIPVFSLNFVSEVYEYLIYTKDIETVKELMPTVKTILSTFISLKTENGLIARLNGKEYWNFYEWCDELAGGELYRDDLTETVFDAPLNAILAYTLKHAIKLYSLLGEEDTSKYYKEELAKTLTSLELFWDQEKGIYADFLQEDGLRHYSELTQSLFGCVIEDQEKLKRIRSLLASNDSGLVPISVSCTLYKYEALMRSNNMYAETIRKDIEDVWGKMLFAGATSLWETADAAWDFDRAGSLCHAWSAIPIYFYYRYVLGQTPECDIKKECFCGLYDAQAIKL